MPVRMKMNPPIAPAHEEFFILELTKANGITDRLKQTSCVVIGPIRRPRLNLSPDDRLFVKYRLTAKYKAALYQGGLPPEMVPRLCHLVTHNTISDINMVIAHHGNSIVVYFLRETV